MTRAKASCFISVPAQGTAHGSWDRSVITDPTILPVTVGVFGDWGGGKSSIMKMLQKALSDEALYPNVVCLYFNGWTFEGYEDAKSALLSSILIRLGEHKGFGPKVKDWVVKLLRRVKWMELGKLAVRHVGVPVGVAIATGGIGALPSAATIVAGAVAKGALGKDEKSGTETSSESVDWRALIEAEQDQPDLMGVRKFRDEFWAPTQADPPNTSLFFFFAATSLPSTADCFLLDCPWLLAFRASSNGQAAQEKILFQTESVGCPTVTTALHTELGATLVICVLWHATATTAYFRCLLLQLSLPESPESSQVPCRSVPVTDRAQR